MSRARPFASLASFGAAFAAALAVWNAILGTFVGRTPGDREDPSLGQVLGPGAYVQSEEGFARTRVNSLGMRNPEIGPKPPGAVRVLCLGDSFTSGFQVADGQTYVDRLRDLCGGFEFVNGGRQGVTAAPFLAAAPFYNARVKPDLVVYEFSEDNLKGHIADRNQEFYVVPEGAGFRVVRNAHFQGDSPLLQRFPKLRRLNAIGLTPCVKIAVHNLSLMLLSAKERNRHETYRELSPALCRWIVDSLHAAFPRLVLVYVGRPGYFEPEPPDRTAALLGEQAKRQRVPFVNVTSIVEARYRATGEFSNGFSNSGPGIGHFNALGHRLLAEALAPLVRGHR